MRAGGEDVSGRSLVEVVRRDHRSQALCDCTTCPGEQPEQLVLDPALGADRGVRVERIGGAPAVLDPMDDSVIVRSQGATLATDCEASRCPRAPPAVWCR